MGIGRYARVVVERGMEATGRAEGLTYALTQETAGACVGERVLAPLGRGDKPAPGIIIETGDAALLGELKPSKVKPLLSTSGIRLPESLVELARWMADYYVCPLGMVLAAMLPSAVKKSIGKRKRVELELVPENERPELGPLPPATAEAWAAVRSLVIERPSSLPMPSKELVGLLGLRSVAPLNRLVAIGALREVERTVYRSAPLPWEGLSVEDPSTIREITPTPDQQRIVDGVGAELGAFSAHLLLGVTGSGKTEVYLRLMRRALGRGQTALMLVPEIALTPQTAGRLLRTFGDEHVAVLHSGLTAAQRSREWARAAQGECKLVVGARSAIFAPLTNLGLIVIDEEHATDYKQDQLPRYSARDVGVKRAHTEGCPILLGSATPSLESWANARSGRYRLWKLTERVGGGRLPPVRVIDIVKETKARREPGAAAARETDLIGSTLGRALDRTLAEGGQAILLLNRRGFAGCVSCPSSGCAWTMTCDDCDAAMVLHRHRSLPVGQLLRCHHCLAEQLVPETCPNCGRGLISLGVGTQRLEHELRRFGLTEGETMLRLDGDTMRGARDYFSALSRFASGEVRLLLGTQIVAKGLDFPGVRLVGVISADTSLWMPDFRASERTYQLVSQVAGRAGRGEQGGVVIVQTMDPRQPAIAMASDHRYEAFADRELEIRHASGLPPATRMARIVVRDEDRAKARQRATDLTGRLRKAGGVRVEGPVAPPVERVAGHYRVAVEVIAPTAPRLLAPLRRLREEGLLKSDAQTAVDIDPVSLV